MGFNFNSDRVNLSVSTQSYTVKPNFSSICYTTKALMFDEFIWHIQHGYCFCHQYHTNSEFFGKRDKTISNFKQTSFLWFDFDEAPININEAYEKLTLKPNIAYTTFNNGIKGNRYRFVYLTDFLILSDEEYKDCLKILSNSFCSDINKDFCRCIDPHCLNVSQQMLGSNSDCTLFLNKENSLSKEDFLSLSKSQIKNDCTHFPILDNNNISEKKKRTITENGTLSTLMEKVLDILQKADFSPLLSNIDKVQYDKDSTYTCVENQGIYEIRVWFKDGQPVKVEEGHRSKFLYACGIALKNINPQITLEEMAANMWWIYNHRCTVTEDMRLKDICRIAIGSFSASNPEIGKRKYVINPEYEMLCKKVKMQLLGKARRKNRDNKVLSNFDAQKSIKENAQALGMSKSTICASLKENGISINRNKYLLFCDIYKENPNESIRKLAFRCKVSPSTIQRYKVLYEEDKSE